MTLFISFGRTTTFQKCSLPHVKSPAFSGFRLFCVVVNVTIYFPVIYIGLFVELLASSCFISLATYHKFLIRQPSTTLLFSSRKFWLSKIRSFLMYAHASKFSLPLFAFDIFAAQKRERERAKYIWYSSREMMKDTTKPPCQKAVLHATSDEQSYRSRAHTSLASPQSATDGLRYSLFRYYDKLSTALAYNYCLFSAEFESW